MKVGVRSGLRYADLALVSSAGAGDGCEKARSWGNRNLGQKEK